MPGLDSPFCIGSTTWPGLSKLTEEMGELQQILGKLIATAGDTAHFDGSNLRDRLEEEIPDVQAALDFFIAVNGLDQPAMARRQATKRFLFWKWHTETEKVGT